VLGLFLFLALPAIARDLGQFVRELPAAIEGLLARVEPHLAELGIGVPHSFAEAMEQFDLDSSKVAEKAVAPATAVLTWLLGGTMSALGALASLIVIPVFAFYLLYDFDRMMAALADLVPVYWRPFVVDTAREVDGVLGQFIRGQLIVMLLLAVLYAIAYSIVGVRLGLVIGLVAGLFAFIPYVGGAVALGLALIMSLVDWHGPMQLVWVLVAYGVVQALEGFVITPRVMGEKVGLSAVWVLFALMVGGEAFDFLGVLLALPTAAVIKIFAGRALAWYRRSEFYRSSRPRPDGGGLAALLREEGLPDDPALAARKREALGESAPQREGSSPTFAPPGLPSLDERAPPEDPGVPPA
jgi:predicted PurR-regulated permease PerM